MTDPVEPIPRWVKIGLVIILILGMFGHFPEDMDRMIKFYTEAAGNTAKAATSKRASK